MRWLKTTNDTTSNDTESLWVQTIYQSVAHRQFLLPKTKRNIFLDMWDEVTLQRSGCFGIYISKKSCPTPARKICLPQLPQLWNERLSDTAMCDIQKARRNLLLWQGSISGVGFLGPEEIEDIFLFQENLGSRKILWLILYATVSGFNIHVRSPLPCATRNYSKLSPGGTKEERRLFISPLSLERMGNSKGMLLP